MNQALFLSYLTMMYLLAFNFAFCMIAAFFCHIFIEGPLMNLIFARQIRGKESEARLQKNLKMLDRTVRSNSENSTTAIITPRHLRSVARGDDTAARTSNMGVYNDGKYDPLSKEYFTPDVSQDAVSMMRETPTKDRQ